MTITKSNTELYYLVCTNLLIKFPLIGCIVQVQNIVDRTNNGQSINVYQLSSVAGLTLFRPGCSKLLTSQDKKDRLEMALCGVCGEVL